MATANVTLDLVYLELLKIRKEVEIIENAVIPVEKLSAKKLEEHKKDLAEALKSKRTNFRNIKR